MRMIKERSYMGERSFILFRGLFGFSQNGDLIQNINLISVQIFIIVQTGVICSSCIVIHAQFRRRACRNVHSVII